MIKKLTMLTAFLFTLLLLPVTTVLAAGGGEAAEGAAEPSGLIMTSLAVLSFVTLAYMIFLSLTDNN
ncbi:MAG: hypothetical protein LPK26_05760 [Bacillaceae bacterium]|uniref:Uncharacterized protein n=1 Tax=Alkalihalobacterium chitinilyticum TaxID=2980103 RepID=A0ABT5VCF7_9BACI|nr:hypothetical protein [Alkalihalobacterium chitinilyticum]MDE5411869.1 hypothetical protein [Alkalihalobacterium chitinilyticum]MEB1806788.1 hypothetical protein [Bacillaceae bacterium]